MAKSDYYRLAEWRSLGGNEGLTPPVEEYLPGLVLVTLKQLLNQKDSRPQISGMNTICLLAFTGIWSGIGFEHNTHLK